MNNVLRGLLLIVGCALLCASCSLLGSPRVFRSDDYVIIQGLREHQTSAVLAKEFLGDEQKSWVIEDFNEDLSYGKGDTVVIPLKWKNKGGLTDDGFQVVPILCYHRFNDDCTNPMCMPRSAFERQMSYLHENGYRTISLEQLFSFLAYREAIPRKSVIITIDDGYRSVYDNAYPVLKKYGFTATLFIYTEFVGVSKNALGWDHLAEMKANGFEIGSHSVSHADLTKRREGEDDDAYRTRIKKELAVSKRTIDKKLQQNTAFFAYPYGRFNDLVIDLTKQAGYRSAVSVRRGSNPFFANPFVLKRDQILKRDLDKFVSRLNCFQELSLSLQ